MSDASYKIVLGMAESNVASSVKNARGHLASVLARVRDVDSMTDEQAMSTAAEVARIGVYLMEHAEAWRHRSEAVSMIRALGDDR